jgi:hypothetical protein
MALKSTRDEHCLYDSAGQPWNTGLGSYWIEYQTSQEEKELLGRSRVLSAVKVKLGQDKHLALFDTGSMNTVLSREQAEVLAEQGHLEWLDEWCTHHSMRGRQRAQYAKADLTFVADLGGQDLLLPDVTLVVPEDWTRLIVVGMRTCLERVRFALDSSLSSDVGLFYFAEKLP